METRQDARTQVYHGTNLGWYHPSQIVVGEHQSSYTMKIEMSVTRFSFKVDGKKSFGHLEVTLTQIGHQSNLRRNRTRQTVATKSQSNFRRKKVENRGQSVTSLFSAPW